MTTWHERHIQEELQVVLGELMELKAMLARAPWEEERRRRRDEIMAENLRTLDEMRAARDAGKLRTATCNAVERHYLYAREPMPPLKTLSDKQLLAIRNFGQRSLKQWREIWPSKEKV